MRAPALLLSLLLACPGPTATAQAPGSDLPHIGTPASTTLSLADEYKIGLMIVRSLRDTGQIVEDPEVTEYLQSLGMRLASHAHEGAHRFTFFAIKDSGINAFALPGGFIGVNAGLVTATRSEGELAGVLAHEIAHVTQRHIARSILNAGRANLASAAATIETGREELNHLETREKERIQDQNQSSVLLGVAILWTGLALIGLYRKTVRLIGAGIHAEQTIRQLSLHDALTGLANRRFLHENTKHLIAAAKRSGKQMAVLVVDLDNFKPVNDRYGHAAGDAVLVTSAERMKQLLRESDVIARFGGDEFVIVLGQVDDAEAAREVAGRVVDSLCQPIPLAGGETAQIGASVGIAMCCGGSDTLDDMLKKADAALYAAKRDGKNTYRVAGASGV